MQDQLNQKEKECQDKLTQKEKECQDKLTQKDKDHQISEKNLKDQIALKDDELAKQKNLTAKLELDNKNLLDVLQKVTKLMSGVNEAPQEETVTSTTMTDFIS